MILMTVEQVAPLIHKKISTIYKDIIRRPHSLPPIHRLPNCRAVYFKNVAEWIAGELPPAPKPNLAQPAKKRGRPSHASRIAGGTL